MKRHYVTIEVTVYAEEYTTLLSYGLELVNTD